MKHVMVDIETLGNNSVIVSVGAVKFNIETGETGDEFYQKIDIDSCLNLGMEVNGATIRWWFAKSDYARKEIIDGGIHISQVLVDFNDFVDKDNILWSNGLRFDIAILENAYRKSSWTETPWNFRNERDVRTLVSFIPEIKSRIVNSWNNVLHHALNDCHLQIKYCSEIYNKLKI